MGSVSGDAATTRGLVPSTGSGVTLPAVDTKTTAPAPGANMGESVKGGDNRGPDHLSIKVPGGAGDPMSVKGGDTRGADPLDVKKGTSDDPGSSLDSTYLTYQAYGDPR